LAEKYFVNGISGGKQIIINGWDNPAAMRVVLDPEVAYYRNLEPAEVEAILARQSFLVDGISPLDPAVAFSADVQYAKMNPNMRVWAQSDYARNLVVTTELAQQAAAGDNSAVLNTGGGNISRKQIGITVAVVAVTITGIGYVIYARKRKAAA